VIGDAAAEVGPALFFSLLIIVLSLFLSLPWRLRKDACFLRWPLQTYAMAAAAGLAVTLIPVLMGYLIRGKIPDEQKSPESLPDSDVPAFTQRGAKFPENHFANCWLDCNSNSVANGTAWR
jgi:hypothetical protein